VDDPTTEGVDVDEMVVLHVHVRHFVLFFLALRQVHRTEDVDALGRAGGGQQQQVRVQAVKDARDHRPVVRT